MSTFDETGDSENHALPDNGGNNVSDETGNDGKGNTGSVERVEFLGARKRGSLSDVDDDLKQSEENSLCLLLREEVAKLNFPPSFNKTSG